MYILRVRDHFDAAHFLPWHEGKCKNLHGHRWEVEVVIQSEKLDENGLVMDFGIVKQLLERVMPDHHDLNSWVGNPTAECIAERLYWEIRRDILDIALDGHFEGRGFQPLRELTVWESPNCSVTYRPEE